MVLILGANLSILKLGYLESIGAVIFTELIRVSVGFTGWRYSQYIKD